MISVARPINGISINGLEFLLTDNGEVMKFQNKEHAIRWLKFHGVSEEEIESFIFHEEV